MNKILVSLALAAALAAPALAKGALDSVTILDHEGARVLARSDVRGGSAELLLAALPAGTRVRVVETDVDGEKRTYAAEVRADGEVLVDVDADGKADQPLTLSLSNKGVSLSVTVTKGEGASVSVTPANETAAAASANRGAPDGVRTGAPEGTPTGAPAGTPSGAPEGTPSGAPATEGSTYTAPTAPTAPSYPTAPTAPAIPPRR